MQEIENRSPTVNYIRTLNIDEPLARINAIGGLVRYYHADSLGSIIGLSDETGQEVTQYVYDPFGNVTISGEASDNPFQYTGRENDGTGLYYYRARYFSPELQRFISKDPIGFKGGTINLYEYVHNNPVKWIDPWGFALQYPTIDAGTGGGSGVAAGPAGTVDLFIPGHEGIPGVPPPFFIIPDDLIPDPSEPGNWGPQEFCRLSGSVENGLGTKKMCIYTCFKQAGLFSDAHSFTRYLFIEKCEDCPEKP